jgi:endonuclease/exonuclease/phosphatase family metal-dependent hydrolase
LDGVTIATRPVDAVTATRGTTYSNVARCFVPMRIATWNCCSGHVSQRLADLAPLHPDIVVLQEVAQPGLPFHDPVHWRGTTTRKGVAITSCTAAFAIAPVPAPAKLASRTAAATVTGPSGQPMFLLVAMWTHPQPNYADNAVAAIRAWRALRPDLPLVVAGDFNVDLGSPAPSAPQRRLEQLLHAECALTSAYHAHRNLRYGQDGEVPTYRHLRRADRTWHIDYCFVPLAWASRLKSAQVMEGQEWLGRSDHSPVVVEVPE